MQYTAPRGAAAPPDPPRKKAFGPVKKLPKISIFPIDFLVYKKDKINLDIRDKIRLDSPYFKDLSDMWHDKLKSSFQELPKFDWE